MDFSDNNAYFRVKNGDKFESVVKPVEETNEYLRQAADAGLEVETERPFRFIDEDDKVYRVPESRLSEFSDQMKTTGKQFAPIVRYKVQDDMIDEQTGLSYRKGETYEVNDWKASQAEASEKVRSKIADEQAKRAKYTRLGMREVFTAGDAGIKDALGHFGWDSFTDPTGKENTAVRVARTALGGGAAAVGNAAAGVVKSAGGMLADVAALGLEAVGAEAGAESVRDAKRQGMDIIQRGQDAMNDVLLPEEDYGEMKETADVLMQSADAMGGIVGIGVGAKGISAGMKAVGAVGKATLPTKIAGSGKVAAETAKAVQAQEQMVANVATTLGMGAMGYEGIYDDPELQDMLENGSATDKFKAKLVGGAKGVAMAVSGKLMHKLIELKMPKEEINRLSENITKKVMTEALKGGINFAGFNSINDLTDEAAKQLLTGKEFNWEEFRDRQVSAIVHGFAEGAFMGGGSVAAKGTVSAYRKKQIEANNKKYFHDLMQDMMNTQRLGKAIASGESTAGIRKITAMTDSGVIAWNDGTLLRKDKNGNDEIVVANGVVLNQEGKMKTIAAGETGETGGGEYGIKVQSGGNVRGVDTFGKRTSENAAIMVRAIENGLCEGEAIPLRRITGELKSWKLEGEKAREVSFEELPDRPIIVLEGANGEYTVVQGRKRIKYVQENGGQDIKAVVLREADGWNKDNVRVFDVMESLASGEKLDAAAMVATYAKLNLQQHEAAELRLLNVNDPKQMKAFNVYRNSTQKMIERVLDGEMTVNAANRIIESDLLPMMGRANYNRLSERLLAKMKGRSEREILEVLQEVEKNREVDFRNVLAINDAVIDKVIDGAMERAFKDHYRKEAAERGVSEAKAKEEDKTLIEMADGEIKSLKEIRAEREKESIAETGKTVEERRAEERGETREGIEAPEKSGGSSLKLREGTEGVFESTAMEGVRIERVRAQGEGAQELSVVQVRGLRAEDILNPDNRERIRKVLNDAVEMADGQRIAFENDATEKAVRTFLQQEQRADETKRVVEENRIRQAELAESKAQVQRAQEIVNKILPNAGIKIKLGSRAEYENIIDEIRENRKRYSIIGELGARNIDKASEATARLDNLAIAREMETAGKDVRAIRLATGWERGKDGKWRYEIDEGQLKEWKDRVNPPLEEVIDAPQLFMAYPQLREYRFGWNGSGNFEGRFLPDVRFIELNVKYLEETNNNTERISKKGKSILLHEIQHAIQHVEGFAKGGDSDTYKIHLGELKDKHDAWSVKDEFSLKAKELGKEASQMDVYDALIKEYRADGFEFGDGYIPSRKAFDKGFNLWVRGYDKEGYEKAFNDYQYLVNKHGFGSDIGYREYNRLAGEVESRNVQTRMGMSPEERRNKTLAETEDVAREDQIALMNGIDVAMSAMRGDGRIPGGLSIKDVVNGIKSNNKVVLTGELPKQIIPAMKEWNAKRNGTKNQSEKDAASREFAQKLLNEIPESKRIITLESGEKMMYSNKGLKLLLKHMPESNVDIQNGAIELFFKLSEFLPQAKEFYTEQKGKDLHRNFGGIVTQNGKQIAVVVTLLNKKNHLSLKSFNTAEIENNKRGVKNWKQENLKPGSYTSTLNVGNVIKYLLETQEVTESEFYKWLERNRSEKDFINTDKKFSFDGEEQQNVQGYWDRETKQVVLFGKVTGDLIAHELGWHAVYSWAEVNQPRLFRRMQEYARTCPKRLREEIERRYESFDEYALLDEVGAGRFEKHMGEKFQKLLRTSESTRTWWQKFRAAVAKAWKGTVRAFGGDRVSMRKLESMDSAQAMEYIVDQISKGKMLGKSTWGDKGGKRFAIGKYNGEEIAVVEDRLFTNEDARNVKLVRDILLTQVGQSYKQKGQERIVRLSSDEVKEFVYSKYSKNIFKNNKDLWESKIEAGTILGDIIRTTALGSPENPKHKNKAKKIGGKFYRCDSRYVIRGKEKDLLFPCKMIILETRNGERFIYDIVSIKKPRVVSPSGLTDLTPKGEWENNSSASNISNNSVAGKRPKLKEGGEARNLPAKDLMDAIWFGGHTRIIKPAAEGYGNMSLPGMEANTELVNSIKNKGQTSPVLRMMGMNNGAIAMSMSEMVRIYRYIRGSAALPRVVAAKKGQDWVGQMDAKGEIKLISDTFGVMDTTDLEMIKMQLKTKGYFRNEDPKWNAAHTDKECANERLRSEIAQEKEAEKRMREIMNGEAEAVGRNAINVMAHELGHIACFMKPTQNMPPLLRGMNTIGKELITQFERARSGAKDPKSWAEWKEALELVKEWRGVAEQAKPNQYEAYFTKNSGELWAECFGVYLAAPEYMYNKAPRIFNFISDAISRNQKLFDALNEIKTSRAGEGPAEIVMREIEKNWTRDAQERMRKFESEMNSSLLSRTDRIKTEFLYQFWDTTSPAMYMIKKGVYEHINELKKAYKAGTIDKKTFETLKEDELDYIRDFRMANLFRQRGGSLGKGYAIDFHNEAIQKIVDDGNDINDFRRYLKAKRVIEVQGKAMDAGISMHEANQILEGLKAKLGDAKYDALELAQREFQATRQKHILENDFVVEMFGKDLVEYWKSNTNYVRTKRILGVDELKEYEKRREDWRKNNPDKVNVLQKMEFILELKSKKAGNSANSFLKKLEGSLKFSEDPLAATIENDLRILEAARRNHYLVELANNAKALGLKGFEEIDDIGKDMLRGSKRYGTASFLREGQSKMLVMPEVVARGLEYDPKSVNCLLKFQKVIASFLTQYSPRFAVRNTIKSRDSNSNLLSWMRESALVRLAGAVGLRSEARVANTIMEVIMSHKSDKAARNPLMNIFFGDKTNLYYIGQATRIAEMMMDATRLTQAMKEADKLALEGKYNQAQDILEDIQIMKDLMKKPLFAGIRDKMRNDADKTNIDELMYTLGLETNLDANQYKGLGKVKKWLRKAKDTVKNYNDLEEARVKIIAELAAHRANEKKIAKGEKPMNQKDVDYQVAMFSGSPNFEARGAAMNVIETSLGPFMNVGNKGAMRNIESMKMNPVVYFEKLAERAWARTAEKVIWAGGGYLVLSAIARALFTDEEKEKGQVEQKLQAFERYGARMARAYANCSDYRNRNYDLIPIASYGDNASLVINLPRSDEDTIWTPLVDMTVSYLTTTDAAEEVGLYNPYKNYSMADAVYNSVFGSGLVPDMNRAGIVWTLGRDIILPWFMNPQNTFTQRKLFKDDVWNARWEAPIPFIKAQFKQVWNTIGGSVIVPASTWDEDETEVPKEGKWAQTFAPEGDEGCMPISGKTVFDVLHKIPFVSSTLSGVISLQTGGNEKIRRRWDQSSEQNKITMKRVANECTEMYRASGEDYSKRDKEIYAKFLEDQCKSYNWNDDDKQIVEAMINKKVNDLDEMEAEQEDKGKSMKEMLNEKLDDKNITEKERRQRKNEIMAMGYGEEE